MKKLIFIFILGLSLVTSAQATGSAFSTEKDIIVIETPLIDVRISTEDEIDRLAAETNWLYEILFTEADRRAFPKETYKSFKVHLHDSFKEYPHPDMIQARFLRQLAPVSRVKGSMGYVSNIVRKAYSYDIVKRNDGELVMAVRVHLKDGNAQDYAQFQTKMKQAEQIWNNRRAVSDFKYSFQFDMTANASQAHYSVRVTDSTRGPYDTVWGRNWSHVTIAHELGHMLGLGDEYQTISGKIDCFPQSLMCKSSTGQMMPHHYYFVLRRLVQPQTF